MGQDADRRERTARSWCAWEDRLATLHVVEGEDHGGADITDQLLIQATDRLAQ